mmetsp:Transcript_18308/g.25368  ORF Transcript_18308/g.25368 Transcript_18308/m.25368 type:complete len:129 (-) Transcript_18308:97-483(-)
MNPDWDDSKVNARALLAMVALGIGEIVGAILTGFVQDKYGYRIMIIFSLILTIIAFIILIAYNQKFVYGPITFFMTLTWGMQNSATNTFLYCVCGFQFESKTKPFSVLNFIQALFVFFMILVVSSLKD